MHFRALIKTRKGRSTLAYGNFEEVNTIVNTEINPAAARMAKTPEKE